MSQPIRAVFDFWCAAFFIRRAPHRDRANAVKVLANISRTKTGKIKDRADSVLRDLRHDPDRNASAEGDGR